MGLDLNKIQRDYDEKCLMDSIKNGNRPEIVKYMRKLSGNIPPDLVLKLADFLDPENPKVYKCGPKPRKRSWRKAYTIAGMYAYLCEDRELARFVLNRQRGNEAFLLIENSDLYDADDNFAPQWKFPHMERTRQSTHYPKKIEIRVMVCEMYGIKDRAFDDMLATYNKK